MRRVLLLVLTVAALAPGVGLYAVRAAGAPAADAKLFASVGPGFTISLQDAAGAAVTHLDPGTYDVQIDDRSDIHNFHLVGPGSVSAATEVGFVGIRTITVTLVNGQYTFVCDVHPYDMLGQFTVGSAGTPPPATRPPVKLVGTVGPGSTISLKRGATRVKTLKPGRYAITVRDRSAKHDFHLRGPGLNKATGVRFRGTRTWTVRLRAGLYRYVSDPQARTVRGSFRVR